MTTAAPRLRPRRRRWLIACLVLLGVPPACLYWSSRAAQHDLDAVRAEIDASDPRWRLADIEAERKTIPDARNSALVVARVHRLMGAPARASSIDEWLEMLPAEARLTPDQAQELREALMPLAEARVEALVLKDFPEGRHRIAYAPDFISTLLPHVQNTREVMRLLQHDVVLRAEEEDYAAAVAACQALLNTARSLGDEPITISQLVRGVGQTFAARGLERALGQGEAPEAALAELQGLMQREQEEPLFYYAMRGERAGCAEIFRALASGQLTQPALASMPGAGRHWGTWLLAYVPLSRSAAEATTLRATTDMVGATRLPLEQQTAAFARFRDRFEHESALAALFGHQIAILLCRAPHVRSQAFLRSAIAGAAAERYRLRHGRWPQALADLVADGLLPAVFSDPYDGQPLRWRLLPDGAVAYSVGADGVDQQGTLDFHNPPLPDTDIGFRLWHPALRRQPPRAP
jgi:hypothetical protein